MSARSNSRSRSQGSRSRGGRTATVRSLPKDDIDIRAEVDDLINDVTSHDDVIHDAGDADVDLGGRNE